MNLQQLIEKAPELRGKNILIIGAPASGKSYLIEKILPSLPGTTIIHTDSYMSHGFDQSLYAMIDDLKEVNTPTVIEGILGYRLLRKGVELDCYHPDVVIEILVSDDTITKRYNESRDPAKLKSVMSTIKACHTILDKYEAMPKSKKPEWIQIENN